MDTRRFQCVFCNFCSRLLSKVRAHVMKHIKKNYACKKCRYSSHRMQFLKRHTSLHDKGNIHQCSLCSYSNNIYNSYKDHLKDHPEVLPYKCLSCEQEFLHKETLKRHHFYHHKYQSGIHNFGETGNYICEHCDRSFQKLQYYNMHVKGHLLKTLKCNKCSYSCKTQRSMKSHVKIRHKRIFSSSKPMIDEYEDPEDFIPFIHNDEHVSISSDLVFPKVKSGKNKSMKNAATYKCVKCPYNTKVKISFHLHAQTHYGVFKCMACPFTCDSDLELKKHVRLEHAIPGNFQCQQCGRVFGFPHHLSRHIDSIYMKNHSTFAHTAYSSVYNITVEPTFDDKRKMDTSSSLISFEEVKDHLIWSQMCV